MTETLLVKDKLDEDEKWWKDAFPGFEVVVNHAVLPLDRGFVVSQTVSIIMRDAA